MTVANLEEMDTLWGTGVRTSWVWAYLVLLGRIWETCTWMSMGATFC